MKVKVVMKVMIIKVMKAVNAV